MADNVIALKNVRLSFASLFEKDNYGRYSATFILDPETNAAEIAAIEAEIERVATEKWGEKAKGVLAKIRAEGNCAYSTKEKLDRNGEVFNGFEGKHWLSANLKTQPTVIDRDRSPLTRASGRPYNGCYVVARVGFWAQDSTEYGRRINCELQGVQFYRDGEAFSGGRPADIDDFEDLSEGVDAADDLA